MHYHAEVWVPYLKDITEQVATAMAPYKEQDGVDYVAMPFHWDWYVIGGRWNKGNGNIKAVADLAEETALWTLVTPEGAFAAEVKNPEWDNDSTWGENTDAGRHYFVPNPQFAPKLAAFRANLLYIPGYLVTVDYHN